MKFSSLTKIFNILGRTLTRRSTYDAGKLRFAVMRKPLYSELFSWSSMIYRSSARTQGLQTACRRVCYMAARRNWNFSCNANFNFQLLFSIFVRTFHVHWPINRSSNVAGFGQFQTPRSLTLSHQHLFLAQLFRDHRASGVNKATEGPHRCLIQWTLGVLDHVA